MSLILAVMMVLGTVMVTPTQTAHAAQPPQLTVVSTLTGNSEGVVNGSGYTITARDPDSGRYLDVQFDVSSVNSATFDNLSQRAVQANGTKSTYFGGMTQFYVKASTYSNTSGMETKKVFGPFNLDTSNPTITITSGLPDPSATYDSFSVSYQLADTYSGIDLEASNYSWSTSSTTTGGNKYKFATPQGTISTPAGLSGSQYLHMNVMDKAGHTATKVIGPIHLTGNGAQITFSGIDTGGNIGKQNVRINVATPSTGINFTQSYYEVYRAGSSPVGNKVSINNLETFVTIDTPGDWYIDVRIADNSGQTYSAMSPRITVGTSTNTNADVSYSPNYSTTGDVVATIRIYDTDGGYVTPLTSGVNRVNDTTFEYTFRENGTRDLEFQTRTGRILRVPLSVSWINKSEVFTVRETSKGAVIEIKQPGRVNFNNSWYRVGNTKKYINKNSTTIEYAPNRVGVLEVNIEEMNGNILKDQMVIRNLPNGYNAFLEYVRNSDGDVEARMSWSGFAGMVDYPRGSGTDRFTYTFRDNGYGVASFRDSRNQQLHFDLFVDSLRGPNLEHNIDSGFTSNHDARFENNYLVIDAYNLKSNAPTINLKAKSGTIDLNRSFYQVDGGRKEYFRSVNEKLSLPSNWKEVFVHSENTRGDMLEGTFYYGENSVGKSNDLYKGRNFDIYVKNLDTNKPEVELKPLRGATDLRNSYYQFDNGRKEYFRSEREVLSAPSNWMELRVYAENRNGEKDETVFHYANAKTKIEDKHINMTGLDTNNPIIEINKDVVNSVDYKKSYYRVNKIEKKYAIKENNQKLKLAGNGQYTVEVVLVDKYSKQEIKKTFTGQLGQVISPPALGVFRYSGTNKPKYLNGYPDGTTRPENPVTRAEFYKMLEGNLVGNVQHSTAQYTDLKVNKWYYQSVTRLLGMGLNVKPGNLFNPDEPITRGEAAAVLVRLNLNGDVKDSTMFSDVNGHMYQNDILLATKKGLVSGYPDGTFKPNHGIRRSEAVVMINNAVGRKTGVSSGVPQGVIIPPGYEVSQTNWAFWDMVDALNGHTVLENKRGIEQKWGTTGLIGPN